VLNLKGDPEHVVLRRVFVFNLPAGATEENIREAELHGSEKYDFITYSTVRSLLSSVADPGSGAFLPPGSGIRVRDEFFPDPGFFLL
jgi:hypothetical protein